MQVDLGESELQSDVASIQKIPIMPSLLDVVCRTTGMGFVAVARVTDDRWITCSALDNLGFGLISGSELKIETTLCNEVKQSNAPVIIDHVAQSEYANHPTPAMYGFQSYISIPIYRKDGRFFGTLCAIDPKPARLNTPEVIGMFRLFCDLIAFHLSAVEEIETNEYELAKEREERAKVLEQKNAELQKMNLELESFAYVASHDLQEPLRKIETFSNFILDRDYDSLSPNGKNYFDRLLKSVKRMQTLIKDLLRYSQVKVHEQIFVETDLDKIVEEVKQDYNEELNQKNVLLQVGETCSAHVIPFQFNQLLQNLIGNSIKFVRPGVRPVIKVSCAVVKGSDLENIKLLPGRNYCHLVIEDNGIGFSSEYNEKIFEVFQRLNGREDYEGTGIGLSIVKKIVGNHHGLITASGELDKGARFDIYIPQP